MEDLRDAPFISLPRHTQVMLQLFKMLDEAGIKPDIRIETLISSTACAMVSQGIGISVVDPLSAKLFENQNITYRPFELAIDFTFRIVHPTRGPTSRLAKSFMEQLAVELESEAWIARVS